VKTCILIDVAVPTGRNVVQKEAENKLRYKSSCIEIQWIWNLKCKIIAVIIGAKNKRLKEKFGSHTRKTFSRFRKKDSYPWNITHNTESTAVWNWKPEQLGITVGSRELPGSKGLWEETTAT
jgi:hypothetical protein